MRTFILMAIFLAFGFAYSCQKSEVKPPPSCDKPTPCHSQLELIPISDTCIEPLLMDFWGLVMDYPGQVDFYRFAAFDPSAYEQFLFYHGVLYGAEILKGANFCTGEMWIIEDSIPFSSSITRLPKWSEKGWILLVRWQDLPILPGEQGLYKIKSDGDSLIQLLSTKYVDLPIWIEGGDKIFCRKTESPFERLILNSNGEFLANFPVKLAPASYYGGKYAGLIHSPDLKIVVVEDSLITKELWPVNQANFDFNGLDWLNEEEIVWITSKGIYRGNINTSQYELVKEVCPNIYYSSVSAARDGSNRLLLTRRDYLFENGITDSMSVRYNISLYDLDTGEEFYVKLGEM